ncbi:MAG TPA: response regulator [Bryobacteraceae bacterium]|jgi:DNA-binding response OmpR family regulator|nr:response regulator [Bryobacteraceae bacterium]
MAGEPILIVDDTPVNLKLTRILLVNEGYKVMTAASAEEALELLRSYHPQLILADIQLPGIDGLELTRRIKKNDDTRDITVVALTAFAMKGDEQKAVEAGCDGYITKPIDTRSLGARIREHLNRRVEAQGTAKTAAPPAASSEAASLPAAEMLALRRKFLSEGQEAARQMLLDLDGQFNAGEAAKKVHNWIGTGGLLGYSAISRLAREVEAVLVVRPLENDQLRDSLTNLALAFNSPREARDAPLSESIVHALSGKRVALVGLPASDAQRMCVALERTSSVPVFFEATEAPDSKAVLECHLAVVNVRPEMGDTPWLRPGTAYMLPLVFVGNRDHLLSLDQTVQALATEFLMDSWQPEEALVRLSLALSQQRVSAPQKLSAGPATSERTRVVIADDDPTVLALVRTALANFGMECYTAVDGPSALDTVRRYRPHAAVLDVNMPGMDGYEVLSAVRGEEIPVRVLLLTARQQESDVIRGFTLGADDYVVKPFSPMELVARMKRLLWR